MTVQRCAEAAILRSATGRWRTRFQSVLVTLFCESCARRHQTGPGGQKQPKQADQQKMEPSQMEGGVMRSWGNPVPKDTEVNGDGGRQTRVPMQAFFLRRLDHLVELNAMSQLDPIHRRLVEYALYSTYWDCVRLGLRDEARLAIGMDSAG